MDEQLTSPALEDALKQLVVDESDRRGDLDWRGIDDREPLFGPHSRIRLDSLDALQIALALQQRHGLRIENSRAGQHILENIASMARSIRQQHT